MFFAVKIYRLEDVTDPEAVRQNPKCDRNVCLYGYVRGTHFKRNTNIHIQGININNQYFCLYFWEIGEKLTL